MKKWFVGVLAIVLCLMLAGCGRPAGQQTGAASQGASTQGGNSDIDVVLVVPNSLGDKAFADMVWNGINMAKEKYGLGTIRCIELQGNTASQVPTLTELAELGEWDIIVTGTFSLKEAIETVAPKFPEQKFIVYDTELDYSQGKFANCVSYAALQNEGSFLAGALGALMSETGTIGFVGGIETTSVSDFLVGYIEGAKYIDPTTKIYSSFIGNFTDTSSAKELALSQNSQGADIIFAVSSGAGLGVYDAARERGFWAIGVDSDVATILEDSNPATAGKIMTSVVKYLDVILSDAIGDYISGDLAWGKHIKVNLAGGGIGLADNKYYQQSVPEEVRARINALAEKITSGEVKVASAIGMAAEVYQGLKSSAIR